jgi:phosphohistidine phosphatase
MADRDRPLSPRGRRAATLVAAEIARRNLRADRILCSPARRTRETLAAILPSLRDETRIAVTADLYEPVSGDYCDVIRRRGDEAETLMVIGHNPALQATALVLGDGPLKADIEAKLPAGALVIIDFAGVSWAAVEAGSGQISEFIKPAELPADSD